MAKITQNNMTEPLYLLITCTLFKEHPCKSSTQANTELLLQPTNPKQKQCFYHVPNITSAFNIIFKKKHQLGINTHLPKALLAIVKSGQMKNNSTINSLPLSHSVQLTDLVSFA